MRLCETRAVFAAAAAWSGEVEAACAALERSLHAAGGRLLCRIGETPSRGRGLVATTDLAPGEVALRVPLSLALVEPDLGEADHWGGRLAERLLTSGDQVYARTLPRPPPTPARGDWPDSIVKALQDPFCEAEVAAAWSWRQEQWALHGSGDKVAFLDALDLVCSRTVRCSDSLCLVPMLDMANHADAASGGGYYIRDAGDVCLVVGSRGARRGDELTLDYGPRRNVEWLVYYGFVPERNVADEVVLPGSRRRVTWADLPVRDAALRDECRAAFEAAPTRLGSDHRILKETDLDYRLRLAIEYRVAQKMLLAAAAGLGAARPETTAFLAAEYD